MKSLLIAFLALTGSLVYGQDITRSSALDAVFNRGYVVEVTVAAKNGFLIRKNHIAVKVNDDCFLSLNFRARKDLFLPQGHVMIFTNYESFRDGRWGSVNLIDSKDTPIKSIKMENLHLQVEGINLALLENNCRGLDFKIIDKY